MVPLLVTSSLAIAKDCPLAGHWMCIRGRNHERKGYLFVNLMQTGPLNRFHYFPDY